MDCACQEKNFQSFTKMKREEKEKTGSRMLRGPAFGQKNHMQEMEIFPSKWEVRSAARRSC